VRPGVVLALGFGMLHAHERGFERIARSPGSLEPESKMAMLEVRHEHRVVQGCTVHGERSDLRCRAVFGKGDGTTSMQLVPLKTRRLRSRGDDRKPVAIHVGVEGALDGGPIEVDPGTWEISWPGYPRRKAFVLQAGRSTNIVLQTTTGRCDRVVRQCALVAGAVAKRVEVDGR
jgi:hypothetical protein